MTQADSQPQYTKDEALALAMRNLRRAQPSKRALKVVDEIEGEIRMRLDQQVRPAGRRGRPA